MSTQQTVTTRAKNDLVFVHEYGDDFKKSLTLRLRASVKGIVPWLVPDPTTGRVPRPDADTFDDFLELVVHPSDAKKLADAIEKDTFSDAARYDAAVMAWKNSLGERDYLSVAARIAEMQKEAERLEMLVEQAQEVPTEDEEDVTPLDD